MIDLGYKVIDLHTHLREDISFHTNLARAASIDTVLYMLNTMRCLDSSEDQKILSNQTLH